MNSHRRGARHLEPDLGSSVCVGTLRQPVVYSYTDLGAVDTSHVLIWATMMLYDLVLNVLCKQHVGLFQSTSLMQSHNQRCKNRRGSSPKACPRLPWAHAPGTAAWVLSLAETAGLGTWWTLLIRRCVCRTRACRWENTPHYAGCSPHSYMYMATFLVQGGTFPNFRFTPYETSGTVQRDNVLYVLTCWGG